MNISFKNRIALLYLIVTGIFIGITFWVIFSVSKQQIFQNLDDELEHEAADHYDEMIIEPGYIYFKNKRQWEEREHTEVQVNPIFIQLVNVHGNTMDKSPNIKHGRLHFYRPHKEDELKPIDDTLNGQRIRQLELPILEDNELKGYMLIAISSVRAWNLVDTLRNVLIVAYPLVLLLLFFLTRILAAKSIQPVQRITETTDRITRNNLYDRIELPKNKDELYTLTQSINELLGRIQGALEREKQFTSDASHELRTPLTVMQGTLEVLLRKPRTAEEFTAKILATIQEIKRMNALVDQLLFIAREEKVWQNQEKTLLDLGVFLTEFVHQNQMNSQHTFLWNKPNELMHFKVNSAVFELIIRNIISNAEKNSPNTKPISLRLYKKINQFIIEIEDNGNGISPEDLQWIYQPFFRAQSQEDKRIPGVGLGLSIVQKACLLSDIKIEITSQEGKGTCVVLSGELNP